jgi:hypothetical protein
MSGFNHRVDGDFLHSPATVKNSGRPIPRPVELADAGHQRRPLERLEQDVVGRARCRQ